MKKTIQALAVAAVAVAAVALTGCYSVPGSIQHATKPLDQNGYTVVAKEVSATDTQVTIFGFGASDLRGSISRRLYQNCLNQARGSDALIEYTQDEKVVAFPPFFSVRWFTLTGTAVQSK
jgi:predicted small secreted protein